MSTLDELVVGHPCAYAELQELRDKFCILIHFELLEREWWDEKEWGLMAKVGASNQWVYKTYKQKPPEVEVKQAIEDFMRAVQIWEGRSSPNRYREAIFHEEAT